MTFSRQTVLMCAPDYFGVDYVINPWMADGYGKTNHNLALRQWEQLQQALAQHVDLAFVPPQKRLPDMVFTANAGLVLGTKAIASRFLSPERRGEEVFFREWFEQAGFTLLDWPQEIPFEGAGDALFDRGEAILWAGHGFRSDAAAAPLLEKLLGRRTIPLRLVDPRFYHLDTCLCPLAGGYLMYLPQAFDVESQARIADIVPEHKRIVVDLKDALLYACNAVDLDQHVFFNGASDGLRDRLRAAGFTPALLPLSEYMKSGGAAKCLTLKLIEN